jgi:hypothetical protein
MLTWLSINVIDAQIKPKQLAYNLDALSGADLHNTRRLAAAHPKCLGQSLLSRPGPQCQVIYHKTCKLEE